MTVPALTISPSLNLVRAKSLAAASLSNVLVSRGCRRLDSVPSSGTSKVTYQVCFMPKAAPSVRWPIPARQSKAATGTKRWRLLPGLRNRPLPPGSDTIDATIRIAAGVMTDCGARHRAGPEHDACPSNATRWVGSVLAIHDRIGWAWIERETCKAQQGAGSNPGNSR
jgi:hypothetical protein